MTRPTTLGLYTRLATPLLATALTLACSKAGGGTAGAPVAAGTPPTTATTPKKAVPGAPVSPAAIGAALGLKSETVYDGSGNVTQTVTYSDQLTETKTFVNGAVSTTADETSSVDAQGVITDATVVTAPDGTKTSTKIVTTMTKTNTTVVSYLGDQVTSTTTADFDAAGNNIAGSQLDATGRATSTTTSQFDSQNRVTSTVTKNGDGVATDSQTIDYAKNAVHEEQVPVAGLKIVTDSTYDSLSGFNSPLVATGNLLTQTQVTGDGTAATTVTSVGSCSVDAGIQTCTIVAKDQSGAVTSSEKTTAKALEQNQVSSWLPLTYTKTLGSDASAPTDSMTYTYNAQNLPIDLSTVTSGPSGLNIEVKTTYDANGKMTQTQTLDDGALKERHVYTY